MSTTTRRRASAEIQRPSEPPEAGLGPAAIQMLDVAEKLFAEKGLEKVSLRDIMAASGQRNLSAARYHFGGREQLVGLLLARRIWFINELRHAGLDALEAAGQAGNVHALVRVSVGALADVVRSQPWGVDYVQVVAQALFSPQVDVGRLVDPIYLSGHQRFTRLIRQALPRMPERAFRDRIRVVNNENVYALARWVQDHGPVTPANRRRYDALVRHTIDFLAAGMAAPHGETP